MQYTYSINKGDSPQYSIYTREELTTLTTLQLRDVCRREKIVVGAAYKLDRPYLIDLILKYRGAKQYTFIDTLIPERFQPLLEKIAPNLDFADGNEFIHIPTEISLYKGLDITVYDNYIVESTQISEGNAFLLDDQNKPCGILNIRKHEGKHYITCHKDLISDSIPSALYRNYSIGFLTDMISKQLHSYYYGTTHPIPTKPKCYVKNITELRVSEVQEASTSLVIDFGTSNSSAGSYIENMEINEITKVKFVNTEGESIRLAEILPTVVSVENCSDPKNIKYRFGYDAVRTAKKNHFAGKSSIFHEIKKWINNYDKAEEVSDDEGHMAAVPRKAIIRAYFDYIISAAEQQHKCRYTSLHITSPVKQKQQFLTMYQDILDDYKVITETALDEGIAVLYNSISDQITDHKFIDGEEYSALIIDCGGGTTDLTSCVFRIKDNRVTYKLDMSTTYANGETNFGGNNLTYRIFQFLKILFANYYSNESVIKLEQLFDTSVDMYRYVDDNGTAKVYEKLEQLYRESESTLPTCFAEYKTGFSEDYIKVKSNFHFLWNLAEKIKTDFFGSHAIVNTVFHKTGLVSHESDKILAEESWILYVYKTTKNRDPTKNITTEQRTLTLETKLPDVVVTKEEVIALIKADIYRVIKKFIEPLYDNAELDYINLIRLTGQTCKIDIFRDALKEFLPGKLISSGKKERSVHDLKLTCLEGAAKYQNAKKIGMIAPSIKNEAAVTPYRLVAHTHSGTEVMLIEHSEKITKTYGSVSRHIDTESVVLILLNADDRLLHRYTLSISLPQFIETSYEEMSYQDKILQDDIDNIQDDEMKIFTLAFEDRWGFYVLPIARKEGNLLMGDRKYFPFENDEWELNFFDGSK